jgi:hypothetical protein
LSRVVYLELKTADFYLANPDVAQALEFDVNQSNGVYEFIFGTQPAS